VPYVFYAQHILSLCFYLAISKQLPECFKDTSVVNSIHGESGVGESSESTSIQPHLEWVILKANFTKHLHT